MGRLEPWAPWRYVTEVGATGRTVQEYRDYEAMLRLGMKQKEFGQLMHVMQTAEITTRAIFKMLDQSPNVLDAGSTEDKP